MDLDYPPEAEAFRTEIRNWLADHLPADGSRPAPDQWAEALVAGGWICATWPVEYGGQGLSLMQAVVLNEEFDRAGVTLRADFFGDTLVGPTILRWGSEAQKQEFLPQILSGHIRWCQGFSEPDAGSDLASLKTRAVLDGDEWVIHGQKVWTTGAQEADYIFLLARTDPAVPRHAGISYLLVPMKQPGVEVRPIRQIDGSAEFNEVFFDAARCPSANVVGGVNNGWTVAMTTLGFERGTSATTGYRRFKKELDDLILLARELGVETTSGLVVSNVTPGGRAAAAGLRPGDVIEQVDRKPVNSGDELRTALKDGSRPALLTVHRGDATLFVALPRQQ